MYLQVVLSGPQFATIEDVIIPSASGTLVVRMLTEAAGSGGTVTVKEGSILEWSWL